MVTVILITVQRVVKCSMRGGKHSFITGSGRGQPLLEAKRKGTDYWGTTEPIETYSLSPGWLARAHGTTVLAQGII